MLGPGTTIGVHDHGAARAVRSALGSAEKSMRGPIFTATGDEIGRRIQGLLRKLR
jgi:hypothetical protein